MKKEKKNLGCDPTAAVPGSDATGESGGRATVCQVPRHLRGESACPLATRFRVHPAQTHATSISHAPRPRVRARRAVGGRSGGSTEPGQVQQGQPLSALRHRRVFEIRVGGTPQVQDGGGRDPSLRKGAETRPGTNPPQASSGRRQRILQQDLPRPDDAPGHSPLFPGRGHESQRGGTFQSHLEQRLYRHFTVENRLSFASVLPEIVQGYNRSHHRSIGMAPRVVGKWGF